MITIFATNLEALNRNEVFYIEIVKSLTELARAISVREFIFMLQNMMFIHAEMLIPNFVFGNKEVILGFIDESLKYVFNKSVIEKSLNYNHV